MSAPLHFRCPSCLQVLAVDVRLAGTSAPCPLCAAVITAPAPFAQDIPFGTLLGTHPSPFIPADPTAANPKTKSASSPSKVVLADGFISQSHRDKKDNVATLRMILFAALTLGACVVTALVLMGD